MNIESIDCVEKKFLEQLNVPIKEEVAFSGSTKGSLVEGDNGTEIAKRELST